jgi:hypothetical protein
LNRHVTARTKVSGNDPPLDGLLATLGRVGVGRKLDRAIGFVYGDHNKDKVGRLAR